MYNPLRSEAEMFRLVVVVGLAALPVIVLGLAAGPVWGLIALGLELGIGIGLIWGSSRRSKPQA
jgi:hypothetical protein